MVKDQVEQELCIEMLVDSVDLVVLVVEMEALVIVVRVVLVDYMAAVVVLQMKVQGLGRQELLEDYLGTVQ